MEVPLTLFLFLFLLCSFIWAHRLLGFIENSDERVLIEMLSKLATQVTHIMDHSTSKDESICALVRYVHATPLGDTSQLLSAQAI
ncbi:hypothetical protein BJ165DRAFT_1519827, partial [Panaeolus papilionaceus]